MSKIMLADGHQKDQPIMGSGGVSRAAAGSGGGGGRKTNPTGKYHLLDRIGQGAFGTVHKAKERASGEIVAIKKIEKLDMLQSSHGLPPSVIREISLLKELRHDNIVRLLDVTASSEGRLSLVFEFLETDLKKFMDVNDFDLDPELVQHFMRSILAGLDYCHQRCVLHRDLKPHNLLISSDNSLKLTDFGLGRAVGIPMKKLTPEVVTLWYRSPDSLLGSPHYGTSGDIWSVGCIFAEMATGQPLFAGTNEVDQLKHIFMFLGTPDTRTTWPSMYDNPNARSMLTRDDFLKNYVATCNEMFADRSGRFYSKLGPSGCDLLTKMLHYEPRQRISAAEALNHPYFSEKL